jgi:hypothetical protein
VGLEAVAAALTVGSSLYEMSLNGILDGNITQLNSCKHENDN